MIIQRSFRFCLAADTFDLANGRSSPAHVRGFHPRDDAHAGRTLKEQPR